MTDIQTPITTIHTGTDGVGVSVLGIGVYVPEDGFGDDAGEQPEPPSVEDLLGD